MSGKSTTAPVKSVSQAASPQRSPICWLVGFDFVDFVVHRFECLTAPVDLLLLFICIYNAINTKYRYVRAKYANTKQASTKWCGVIFVWLCCRARILELTDASVVALSRPSGRVPGPPAGSTLQPDHLVLWPLLTSATVSPLQKQKKEHAPFTSSSLIPRAVCSCRYNVKLYKDRAAPPIGGTALHDGGVKTVQWTKREGHDSYQEVEVYIYKYI